MPDVASHSAEEMSEEHFREAVKTTVDALVAQQHDIIGLSVTAVYSDGTANNITLGDLEQLAELQLSQLAQLGQSLKDQRTD